jgi:hypothetical protein
MPGRKVWATFERLFSAELNDVADQTCMPFATVAERALKIPVPVRGMVTSTADVLSGAPHWWDGGAWVALSAGVSLPSMWGRGAASSLASVRLSQAAPVSGTWYEIAASLPTAALIHSIWIDHTGAAGSGVWWELGTGAAAAEIVREVWERFDSSSGGIGPTTFDSQFGVYVPTATRLALRGTLVSGGSMPGGVDVHVFYSAIGTGTQVQAGRTALTTLSGTAWVQVAATPPIGGGVQIIGIVYSDTLTRKARLGLGPAASEVAITGYAHPAESSIVHIPPVEWTSGTRLSAQSDDAASVGSVYVIWRQTLA